MSATTPKAETKIVIVDYGMGNLLSVKKRIDQLTPGAIVTSDPREIVMASKIIIPGVGHFQRAMENLTTLGLRIALNEAVIEKKTPVFGICLGMQLMAEHSEEGNVEGLGWLNAKVVRFKINNRLKFKVPHTGWNQVVNKKVSALSEDIPDGSEFYFVHAYHIKLQEPADSLHETFYEYNFVSAIEKNNIYGVQYHPEKSHGVGETLLRNFVGMT